MLERKCAHDDSEWFSPDLQHFTDTQYVTLNKYVAFLAYKLSVNIMMTCSTTQYRTRITIQISTKWNYTENSSADTCLVLPVLAVWPGGLYDATHFVNLAVQTTCSYEPWQLPISTTSDRPHHNRATDKPRLQLILLPRTEIKIITSKFYNVTTETGKIINNKCGSTCKCVHLVTRVPFRSRDKMVVTPFHPPY